MKAMNFYTANGWAGSNYDSKLSTKEVAANVRSYAKKNFPDFKFSVRSEWSMYTDSMYIESYYTPMAEGMEFYEKKVKGKRYITENRTKRGYYVIDTLDNCPVGFFQTKEEAEREAETLNGFTDGNGRLKTVI
jgi:hypothetical protein